MFNSESLGLNSINKKIKTPMVRIEYKVTGFTKDKAYLYPINKRAEINIENTNIIEYLSKTIFFLFVFLISICVYIKASVDMKPRVKTSRLRSSGNIKKANNIIIIGSEFLMGSSALKSLLLRLT